MRFSIAIVVLSAFDVRMMVAVFIVIPLAFPFAFISMKRMEKEGALLQSSQQQAASGILEYVGGIRTLKAFNMAGDHFDTLKNTLDTQRKAAISIETRAAAPVSMIGRFILNCGIGLVMLVGSGLMVSGKLRVFYYMHFFF